MTPTLWIAENKGRKLSVNMMHKKKHKGPYVTGTLGSNPDKDGRFRFKP